jgi:hypothetical protein
VYGKHATTKEWDIFSCGCIFGKCVWSHVSVVWEEKMRIFYCSHLVYFFSKRKLFVAWTFQMYTHFS